MKNIKESRSMTFEEALQDPSLAPIHEHIRYLQNTPFSKIFPKKHELTLTYLVESKARRLYTENPNMPIKKVITTIFEPLTDDIPAPLMLKLTQNIIDLWAKLFVTNQQDNRVAISV